MADYVKVSSWDRPERESAMFYAMTENDKTDLASEQRLSFGDCVLVLATKKVYIYGADGEWQEV